MLGSGNGYRINGDKILSHPGTFNTFVGRNAGAAWVFPVPISFQGCTFVGDNAGPVSTGQGCSFIGDRSGFNNTSGAWNTFMGSNCGENNTTGSRNTFLGHHAGLNNTTGSGNTFVGYHTVGGSGATTGDNNTVVGIVSTANLTSGTNNCIFGRSSGSNTQIGSGNCFYGANSGFGNITGNNNVFTGVTAGAVNQTGSNNVILGPFANMFSGQTNLSNAIAIGFQAIVSDNNKMILGNNNINVGIGLSNSAVGAGPQKKLEINETGVTSAVVSNTSIPGTFGGSGLRFRKLTSATPVAASNGKLLTVNANGDVILVADQTGTVAAGSIFAQNGLTLVGTNTVELGGTLIHALTVIDFASNTLQYKDAGADRYQRGANGGVWQHAVGVNNKDNQANFSDFALITNPSGGVGKLVQAYPISSFAAASAGIIGEEVSAKGTPSTGIGGINGNVTGVYAVAQNIVSTIGNNYAVSGWAQGASSTVTAINAGFFARANGSLNNYGYYADISNGSLLGNEDNGVRINTTSNAGTPTNRGGYFKSLYGQNVYGLWAHGEGGSATNYGIYAKAVANGTVNIAVYGDALSGPITSTASPFPTTGTYAGYFNGNVVRTGSDNFTSDLNLKQNIDTITNAIGIIKQLKPKTFDYKLSSYPSMSLPSGKQFGLIAQETQTVLPEIINTLIHPAQYDTLGNVAVQSFTYLALEYQQLIPIMIKAMQQQQTKIEKLDSVNNALLSQIVALTSSVNSCCSSSAVRSTKPEELNQLDIKLSNKDIIVLNQNVPNPFAEQTTITYNVPEKYNFAQIIFSTIEGKIIKAVDITKKGKGQLNVFANDLSTGFYTYSLIVDGKTIDTKKMVKSE